MTTGRWETYLSAQGWVILDENNEVLLNTGSDHTGPQVAEIVRRYNELVLQLIKVAR
jgi:hypothetical protein